MPRTGFSPSPTESVVSASRIVAASDSIDSDRADYQCSGVDDHVEINQAISDISSKGGVVLLLEGTYVIGANISLNANTALVGSGIGATILDFENNAFAITASSVDRVIVRDMKLKRSSDSSGYIQFTTSDYSEIRNIEIEAGTTLTNKGIYWSGVSYSKIQGCYIHGISNSSAEGMDLNNSYKNWIVGNIVENCYDGIKGDNLGTSRIIGNRIEQCENYGIYAADTGIIIGNEIDPDNDVGIYLSGEGHICVGNYIDSGTAIQTIGHTRTGIIANNYVAGNIAIGADTDGILVTGNSIRDSQISMGGSNQGKNLIAGNLPINQTGSTLTDFTGLQEIKSGLMKNVSGGQVVEGDVVVLSPSAAGNEFTTTTSAGDNKVIGMATETIADTAVGHIQFTGKTTKLKVDGTTDIAIGDYLSTFTTAGIAQKASAGDMAFAIALEAYATDDSNGVIDALLVTPRQV